MPTSASADASRRFELEPFPAVGRTRRACWRLPPTEPAEWVFEPKLDGWRCLAYVDETVTVRTRTGRDITPRTSRSAARRCQVLCARVRWSLVADRVSSSAHPYNLKLAMVKASLLDLFEKYPARTFTQLEAVLGVSISDYVFMEAPLLDPAAIHGLIVELRGPLR